MKKEMSEVDFWEQAKIIAAKLGLGIRLTMREKRLVVLYRARAFADLGGRI